jgi:1-acyl-sn-glycerol-3-phosphate acyltransferase
MTDALHSPAWTLIRYNADQVVQGLKVEHLPLLREMVRFMARQPVQRLTQRVLELDTLVGELGLPLASQWLLRTFTAGVAVSGAAQIPAGKPLLITSNHPGQTDAFVVLSQLEGHDVRILAGERPLLHLLPNIKRSLIMIPDQVERRGSALRAAAAHLQKGGTLLTFPGGKIEPDPAIRYIPLNWSDSTRLFVRLVPDLHVLPVAVRGVLSQSALNHPLTRLYRTPAQREWVAAILQSLLPSYQNVSVQVTFGDVITQVDGDSLVQLLLRQMDSLIR